jgi:hypothetical protein
MVGILTSPPGDKHDLLPFLPGAILWAAAFFLYPVNWLLMRNRLPKLSTGSESDPKG